ncbi:hypothetical protein [Humisphaera borealis]|uniref:DUF1345 domain-containing protein n=1 Tax=Humisphaera borealis TaxID=2807512 RepID=A0A7M2WV67_9BACT|nr:hypothetical protein [Humisphaera borealis]QOV88380.1 hypothetical protein IPV69_19305 [Humisphaera borealis]
MTQNAPIPQDPESRWPVVAAVLATAGLYAALPSDLAAGPWWLMPVVAGIFAVLLVATRRHYHKLHIVAGHLLSGTMTAFMIWSVIQLVLSLPTHRLPPVALLRAAGALWITNVVVFALWYWRLDAGGPHVRDARAGHETGAFLFPQMTLDGPAGDETDGSPWAPRFVDYLFLAFNTSAAFSPTDTAVLGRWAKTLVMTQAIISLAVVIVLAGRAVNIL